MIHRIHVCNLYIWGSHCLCRAIIGNNFAAFYKNERRREALSEKRAAMERMRRKGAITPFPRSNGYSDHGSTSEDATAGKPMDITELDAGTLDRKCMKKSCENCVIHTIISLFPIIILWKKISESTVKISWNDYFEMSYYSKYWPEK